ncbi:MAG: UvrD-helicase domain-containing protein [Candidatus Eisenbacteria bacterium]|nr:UvrD-helicase domain-containing protein [Candidatus Eisenbacteria bacterium]
MAVATLNPAQLEAVEHERGPALVIAGAGSGKTRVLTGRIARLLERGVPGEAILAFTFTNRAAKEMRERILHQLGGAASGVWIGTFHATAMRILRREATTLGLPAGFSIYDRDDQESIIRDLVRASGLPDTVYKTGMVLSKISDHKNALVRPELAAEKAFSDFDRHIATFYDKYQAALRRAGALDFDDLIGETVRLWIDYPQAGERWSRRFQHILVDEYQDTNHAQFRLVQSLGNVHHNVFVVGDDDQSIYGWRGADLANVLDFERAFPGAVTIRLEQNYRSTSNILDAANAVIANNVARKGKTLWSTRDAGAPIHFVLAPDETFEARRVRHWLQRQQTRGRRLTDCAVLYRTNAQSRALETELRQNGVPYEIVGGVSFFQRREVKDMLAYLRLAVNPLDTASFFRAWNTPRRGLGPAVEAQVRAQLVLPGADPIAALRSLSSMGALKGAARAGAAQFVTLIDELRAMASEPVDRVFAHLLEKSGYLEHLDAAGEEDLRERRSNVEELGVAAAHFAALHATGPAHESGLLAWLSECSLLTDADRVTDGERVLLLTVHNAKGLEFDAVAVAGLEEGLMPHASSLEDSDQLEEERRLFYVALTRARDEVLLTAAAYRRRYDGAWGTAVSRFVSEIPEHLLEREESPGVQAAPARSAGNWSDRSGDRSGGRTRDWGQSSAPRRVVGARASDAFGPREGAEWDSGDPGDKEPMVIPAVAGGRSANAKRAVGKRVMHEKFGTGTVLDAEGDGPDMKLTVRFTGSIKKVLARFVQGVSDGD